MSKELNKNQQNHADWSSEKPSKKASHGAVSTDYSKDTAKNSNKKDASKSSLNDHFDKYTTNSKSQKNSSYDNDDYQD